MPVKVISTLDGRAVIVPVNSGVEGPVAFVDADGKIMSGDWEIIGTINKKATHEDLEGLVKQLKERGIELSFQNPQYKDGSLIHIEGAMKYKDGTNNFSGSDFSRIIISQRTDEKGYNLMVRIVENKVVI